jgi:uncharacterized protein involved in outer membrane biogenesis
MIRLVRNTLLALIIAALLAVVGGGIFLARFDPNEYREQLLQAAQELTGRRIALHQSLNLSFLPQLELSTGSVSVYGPDGAAQVEADDIRLRLPLEPLLRGELEIQEVTARGLRLAPGASLESLLFADPGALPPAPPLPGPAPRFLLRLDTAYLRDSDIPLPGDSALVLHLESASISFTPTDSALPVSLPPALPIALTGSVRDSVGKQELPFSLEAEAEISAERLRARVTALSGRLDDMGDVPLLLEGRCTLSHQWQSRVLTVEKAQGSLSVANAQATDNSLRSSWRGYLNIAWPDQGKPASIQGALHSDNLDLDTLLRGLDARTRSDMDAQGAIIGAPNFTRPKVNRTAAASRPAVLPPKGRNATAETGKTAPSLPPNRLLPRDVSLDLALTADLLTVQGLPLQGLDLKVRSLDRQTSIPFSFTFCGADVNGTGRVDCKRSIPAVAIVGHVKGLNMRLFTQVLRLNCDIAGVGSATVEVSGLADSYAGFLRTLRGQTSFQVVNGQIRGFTLIPPTLPYHIKPPTDFLFQRLAASAAIVNGTARIDDLALQSDILTARGGGVAHLAFGQLDIGIDFMLGGRPPVIPVSISGPWRSVSHKVDLQGFQQNRQQNDSDTYGASPEGANPPHNPSPGAGVDPVYGPGSGGKKGEIYIDEFGMLRTR